MAPDYPRLVGKGLPIARKFGKPYAVSQDLSQSRRIPHVAKGDLRPVLNFRFARMGKLH